MSLLWFASQNENKIKVVKSLLPELEIKTLNDLGYDLNISEDEETFKENALLKAKMLANLVEEPVIADDSGLNIVNLNNFPGIYSARWAKPEKDWDVINHKVLEKMIENDLQEESKRDAFFISAVAFIDKQKDVQKVFVSRVDGKICYDLAGMNGFAYDKIFKPNVSTKTYAEMTSDEKNKISHLSTSIRKLRKHLEENNYL